MPANPQSRTIIGLGGGGISGAIDVPVLGPEQNTFGDSSTANQAAAEALRDVYEAANPTWLTEYDDDTYNIILLQWTGDNNLFQRRNLDGDDWEDVNFVIGVPGRAGAGIQDGTSNLRQLRWNPTAGDWHATNTIGLNYAAFTREGTIASLIAIFNATESLMDGEGSTLTGQLQWWNSTGSFSVK